MPSELFDLTSCASFKMLFNRVEGIAVMVGKLRGEIMDDRYNWSHLNAIYEIKGHAVETALISAQVVQNSTGEPGSRYYLFEFPLAYLTLTDEEITATETEMARSIFEHRTRVQRRAEAEAAEAAKAARHAEYLKLKAEFEP